MLKGIIARLFPKLLRLPRQFWANSVLAVLLVVVLAAPCMAWNPKEFFDQYADKVGHFGIGGTVAGFSVLKAGASPGSALLNTVIVGFAKEQFDQESGGHADLWDWAWTIAGGALIAL